MFLGPSFQGARSHKGRSHFNCRMHVISAPDTHSAHMGLAPVAGHTACCAPRNGSCLGTQGETKARGSERGTPRPKSMYRCRHKFTCIWSYPATIILALQSLVWQNHVIFPKQLQPRQSSGLVPICFDCMSPANCRVGGQYRGNHCMADCTQLFAHRGCCSYAGAVCSTGIPCLSNLKGRTQLRYVSCEADCAKLTSMLGGDQQMLVLLRHSHGMHIDQSYDPKKPEILPVTPSWKASHPPCLLWKFCTCAAHLYLSQYGCLFGLHQLKVKLMLQIQDLT